MEQQDRFETLVMMLAEISENALYDLDEDITRFEDSIENTGHGEAYFGTAKSDWERIEIAEPKRIPFQYDKEGVLFYAEYYDGMRAPFTVCKWSKDIETLETLLKETSPVLYDMYLRRLKEKETAL